MNRHGRLNARRRVLPPMPGASAQPVSAPYSLRQIGQGGAVTSQIHATVTIETPVEKVLQPQVRLLATTQPLCRFGTVPPGLKSMAAGQWKTFSLTPT